VVYVVYVVYVVCVHDHVHDHVHENVHMRMCNCVRVRCHNVCERLRVRLRACARARARAYVLVQLASAYRVFAVLSLQFLRAFAMH
jgi:hypothetical protein